LSRGWCPASGTFAGDQCALSGSIRLSLLYCLSSCQGRSVATAGSSQRTGIDCLFPLATFMRVPKMKAPSDSRHRSSSSKGCRKAASLSKVSVCSRNKIALRGVGAWLAAVATFAVFCAAASAPPSSRHVYGFIVSNTYQNCTSSVNATALFAPSPQVSGLSRPPAARCLLSAPPGRKAGGHTKGDSFSRPASGTGFKDGNHELGRAKVRLAQIRLCVLTRRPPNLEPPRVRWGIPFDCVRANAGERANECATD